MEDMYGAQQVIEMLNQSPKVKPGEIDIEKVQALAKKLQETERINEVLSQFKEPREQIEYIDMLEQKEGLTENERDALQLARIGAQIKLGEYYEANIALRNRIMAKKDDINYFEIDDLIYTERKLGHIRLVRELATAVLRKNPEHVMPRNELIRISIMEGDKEKARKLIERQKEFYAKVRKLKTEAYRTYEEAEAETTRLESIIEGKSEHQILK